MRYVLKQKLFSLGRSFDIRDEAGNELYKVSGPVFTIRDRLSLHDLRGTELASIRQKLIAWGRTYEIFRGGQLMAVVRKNPLSFFHHTFTVDVPGPDDLKVEGDFLDYEYRFTRDGHEVARVSKQWFSWSDTYGLDVADNEDPVLILATAVIVDRCCHTSKGRH